MLLGSCTDVLGKCVYISPSERQRQLKLLVSVTLDLWLCQVDVSLVMFTPTRTSRELLLNSFECGGFLTIIKLILVFICEACTLIRSHELTYFSFIILLIYLS